MHRCIIYIYLHIYYILSIYIYIAIHTKGTNISVIGFKIIIDLFISLAGHVVAPCFNYMALAEKKTFLLGLNIFTTWSSCFIADMTD